MNNTMLQRLLGKEYRAQRGFWLGVAGTALVLQLIVLMVSEQLESRIEILFAISLVMPVFYVLGSAAVTFASEKEDQTWERLRILPTSPGRLFLAKFGFSVVSTLLMAVVLVLLSWGMANGRIPYARGLMIESPAWMLTAGEFLLWGTFLSLLTRRVLSAVCLTPLFAFSFTAVSSFDYTESWTIRLVMMGFLFLASIGLSRRWLKRETLGWSIPWSISLRRKQADYLAVVERASPQKRLFKRLKWQERQQAHTVCFVFLVIGVPLIAVSYWTYSALQVNFAEIVISLVSLLCGVWAFRGEQEGKRFRYLTECGVAPHTVWLSKQYVWITATLSLVLLFVLTDLIASSFHPDHIHMDVLSGYQGTLNKITRNLGSRYVLPVFILYCFTTYSIGQFVSMLFSRAVTAAFVGVMFSVLFLVWLYLMLWLNVPLLFSVWPIPLVLLWATRVRSSDWMLERGGFKPWLRVGTMIVVPGVLTVSGMIYYRSVMELAACREIVKEKYGAALNPSLEESRGVFENALTSSTVEERKTAQIYRRASDRVSNMPREVYIEDPTDKNKNRIPSPTHGWDHATPAAKKWLDDNRESLALILEAANRESCAFLNPAGATFDQSFGIFKSHDMYRLLLFSARKRESENRLDEAFEFYIASLRFARHLAQRGGVSAQWNFGRSIQFQTLNWMRLWTGHPQQTKQLLKKAIDQIRTETDAFPSSAEAITIENGILRRTFIDEPEIFLERISSSGQPHKDILFAFLWRCCPWERTRSVQLLELLTIDELNSFRELQAHLDRRGVDMGKWRLLNSMSYADQMRLSPWNLLTTTPLLSRFLSPHQILLGRLQIDTKTRREAILLTLGLIAYRKEHGELPERLDQLVGEYFDELPLDLWSGREFGYRPDGFPSAVRFPREEIQAGQPLLWSTGSRNAKIMRVGHTEEGKPLYAVVPPEGWGSLKIGDYRLDWGMGIAFPIPE